MANIKTEQAFEIILSNFRTQLEEDLKDEQNMETPDTEIVEQYEKALDKLDDFNIYKFIQHSIDYINEEIDL